VCGSGAGSELPSLLFGIPFGFQLLLLRDEPLNQIDARRIENEIGQRLQFQMLFQRLQGAERVGVIHQLVWQVFCFRIPSAPSRSTACGQARSADRTTSPIFSMLEKSMIVIPFHFAAAMPAGSTEPFVTSTYAGFGRS
jgi:hypothetical protein